MNSNINAKKVVGVAMLLITILITTWWLRAWGPVRLLFYDVLYVNMELTFGLFISIAIGVAYFVKSNSHNRVGKALTVFGVVFCVLFFAFGIMGSFATQTTVANDHMNFEEIDEIQPTAEDDLRLLPMKVGDTYAQNRLQFERHELTQGDITIQEDGGMAWTYNIQPEGIGNQLTIHQAGAVTVDMQQTSANVETHEQEIVPGVGDFAGNNVFWQLKKENFMLDYVEDEAYVVDRNDNLYLVVPYNEHKPEVNFPFPFPYTTPHEGGLAVVDGETGDIEYVDVDDVQDHEIVGDQRAISYDLTRYYVDSMTYKNGIINAHLFKEGVPEVASSPGDGNEQPYLVRDDEGELQLLIAAEPAGDASGIYQFYYQHAQTGEWKRHSVDRGDALVGPTRATDYVQAQEPTVDWDEFTPVEPLPIVRDDGLYWMTRVIPEGGGGVAYIAFVNAEDNTVIPVADDETAQSFIAGDISVGDDVEDVGTDPIQGGDGTQTNTIVTIVDGDDEEEIDIDEDTQIIIEGQQSGESNVDIE